MPNSDRKAVYWSFFSALFLGLACLSTITRAWMLDALFLERTQKTLENLKFLDKPYQTGVLDEKTKDAIKDFQMSINAKPSGKLTAETMAVMSIETGLAINRTLGIKSLYKPSAVAMSQEQTSPTLLGINYRTYLSCSAWAKVRTSEYRVFTSAIRSKLWNNRSYAFRAFAANSWTQIYGQRPANGQLSQDVNFWVRLYAVAETQSILDSLEGNCAPLWKEADSYCETVKCIKFNFKKRKLPKSFWGKQRS